MSAERGSLVALALLAALPVAGLLWARRGQPEPTRFSPGRTMLLYALLFALATFAFRWRGLPVVLAGFGLLFGFLGGGKGAAPIYRFLYTPAWLARYPEALARDVARWHLPFMLLAVLCFAVGIVFVRPFW